MSQTTDLTYCGIRLPLCDNYYHTEKQGCYCTGYFTDDNNEVYAKNRQAIRYIHDGVDNTGYQKKIYIHLDVCTCDEKHIW